MNVFWKGILFNVLTSAFSEQLVTFATCISVQFLQSITMTSVQHLPEVSGTCFEVPQSILDLNKTY